MKSADRDAVIFDNQKNIFKIFEENQREISEKFKDYRFNKYIQFVWLFILTVFVGLKKYLPF